MHTTSIFMMLWLTLSNELQREKEKASSMLRVFKDDLYPMLGKLSAWGLSLPVNTAACEWGFGQMKLIKTDLRNPLKKEMLNNLMLIAVEGESVADFPYDEALKHWSSQRNRRILK